MNPKSLLTMKDLSNQDILDILNDAKVFIVLNQIGRFLFHPETYC